MGFAFAPYSTVRFLEILTTTTKSNLIVIIISFFLLYTPAIYIKIYIQN
jgi:hypothetical protein